MCTLALWLRPEAEVPLVVFANRDERLDRPALPPRVEAGPPRVLTPVDVQEGGTWLGLNEHGLFVGITNRAGAPRDGSRRSRGALVREALAAPSARALRERLDAIEHGVHNAFHLLYADRTEAFLTWDDEHAVHHVGLCTAGGHVDRGAAPTELAIVTEQGHAWDVERPLGARDAFVRRAWEGLPAERRGDLAALIGLLGQHGDSPLDGACVHADAVGYGTRSSFALALAREPLASRALWVEGKPCTVAAVDLGAELAQLGLTTAVVT